MNLLSAKEIWRCGRKTLYTLPSSPPSLLTIKKKNKVTTYLKQPTHRTPNKRILPSVTSEQVLDGSTRASIQHAATKVTDGSIRLLGGASVLPITSIYSSSFFSSIWLSRNIFSNFCSEKLSTCSSNLWQVIKNWRPSSVRKVFPPFRPPRRLFTTV